LSYDVNHVIMSFTLKIDVYKMFSWIVNFVYGVHRILNQERLQTENLKIFVNNLAFLQPWLRQIKDHWTSRLNFGWSKRWAHI